MLEQNFYQAFFWALAGDIRERFEHHPGCHDWDHTRRVLYNARILAEREGADPQVCETGALLHDVGRLQELQDQGATCHAKLGAEMALSLLRDKGVGDEQFVEHVRHCVESHRYRRRGTPPPQTLEAKVVYDADKLDSLGAVGIGRAFHFAGRVGARVHNSADEALASESYSRNDTAYREYLVKLRHVHQRVLTAAAREIARRRHRFMAEFFRELNEECPVRLVE